MTLYTLSKPEILKELETLPGWEYIDEKLRRELVFPSFLGAIDFIKGAAEISEKLNHHPNWSNVYTRVIIELWTHDSGGVTERDLAWARAVAPLCEDTLGENTLDENTSGENAVTKEPKREAVCGAPTTGAPPRARQPL
jgi:4a-hydroxytetrahydrobiopterin dehydratase